MSNTPSTMLDIGTQAPNFSLPEPLTGNTVSLSLFENKPLLVVFSCNHCPYVLHILQSFVEYTDTYMAQGLSVVMINANDVDNYTDDSPEKMIELIQKYKINFQYLYDEQQQVANAYQAACTPDFFLFDDSHALVYRGQFDNARPKNFEPVNGADLTLATQELLDNKAISVTQLPSMGCNIKWKPGNEPAYF